MRGLICVFNIKKALSTTRNLSVDLHLKLSTRVHF